MRVSWGFFQFESWNDKENFYREDPVSKGMWFRLFGYGLHFTNSMLLFSERNGHTKYLKLPFGFRVRFLKRKI